jgi:hypothetical protein
MSNKRLFVAVSASMLVIIIILLVVHISRPTAIGVNETERIDWGYKAYEIVSQDQEFRKIAGDNPEDITGIVQEGEYAYMYYRVDNEIYNVSVDFKNNSVQSIAVENNEKRLRWLDNVSGILHNIRVVPIVTPY